MSITFSCQSVGVNSIRKLGVMLGYDYKWMRQIGENVSQYYKPFIRNKNGKERTIHNPISPLKTIQSRIHKRILAPIELPIHVQGGVKSRSPLTNASLHSGNEVVVAIDINGLACNFPV